MHAVGARRDRQALQLQRTGDLVATRVLLCSEQADDIVDEDLAARRRRLQCGRGGDGRAGHVDVDVDVDVVDGDIAGGESDP